MRSLRWIGTTVLLAWALPLWAQPVATGSEFQVNTYTYYSQRNPAVAADSSGNFVVAWTGNQVAYKDIFAQRFDSTGNQLGLEFQVNTYTDDDQQHPAVAVDRTTGDFVVVWDSRFQTGDSQYGVFGQRYDNTGAPVGSEFHVNTYTSTKQYFPEVAVDGGGSFVVVWDSYSGQDGSGGGIFGQRFDSAGTPLGSEFQVNTYTTGRQEGAAVAADSAGNFVVVWQSLFQDGDGLGIFGRRYNSAGTALGNDFQVNTYTTGDQVAPAVAIDGSDNVVVVWGRYGAGIYGQRYNSSGTALGSEFEVNNPFSSYPAVGADSAGNFMVTWRGYGGSEFNGVFGRAFDSTGTPFGAAFQVNTYTTYIQTSPSVAGGSANDFVVVWESNDQISDEDIFGQRYAAPTTTTTTTTVTTTTATTTTTTLPPPGPSKCVSGKLKAVGNTESRKLACHAKAAAKNDPSLIGPCELKVETKFMSAFANAGACPGVEGTCDSTADDCVTKVAAALPDSGSCEAKKLKAAGKKAKKKLACYVKAAKKGLPVDNAPGGCLDKADTKFAAAFAKAVGCTGDATAIGTLVDDECVAQLVTEQGGVVTDICP